ncbi:hypothetical protein Tcan_10674 [Toxocara canis]|uniref:Uncharacterized protein n=1 Tax=Toxocara canis TaxID=6265 RepID=A0A0B2VJ66_TOXCA|nr:hypothetical protein Tcan_10674 [Toxocara canis]
METETTRQLLLGLNRTSTTEADMQFQTVDGLGLLGLCHGVPNELELELSSFRRYGERLTVYGMRHLSRTDYRSKQKVATSGKGRARLVEYVLVMI